MDRNLENFLKRAVIIKTEELSYTCAKRLEHEVSQYINTRSWAEILTFFKGCAAYTTTELAARLDLENATVRQNLLLAEMAYALEIQRLKARIACLEDSERALRSQYEELQSTASVDQAELRYTIQQNQTRSDRVTAIAATATGADAETGAAASDDKVTATADTATRADTEPAGAHATPMATPTDDTAWKPK